MSASFSGLIKPMRPWAQQLVAVAGRAGLNPRVTSTRRSYAEQTRLYRRYLAGGNPYPVAPPGTSAHEFGAAFDLAINSAPSQLDSDLADLGQVWTSWGGVWGGEFNDPIHFEWPGFPHSSVVKRQKESVLSKVANTAVGFLPAAGWLTLADPHPLQDLDVPWWEDPQGYAHGLAQVFLHPFR